MDPASILRRRLYGEATEPWQGDTLPLKVALVKATKYWKTLAREGLPCPITFDAKDICETMELAAEQTRLNRS